jgi:nucleotide-binding universal stress UspA family protein
MYSRIVVPLDGSDIAEQALATAEDLARSTGATLHLVRVVEFPSTSYTYVYGAMVESEALTTQLEDQTRLADAYLAEVARPITEHGVAVTTEVRHGIACHELIATMKPGDLFVIASHGRSGVARWFLGSVAEEITRHATVPVLLVRAGSPAAARRAPGPPTAMTA